MEACCGAHHFGRIFQAQRRRATAELTQAVPISGIAWGARASYDRVADAEISAEREAAARSHSAALLLAGDRPNRASECGGCDAWPVACRAPGKGASAGAGPRDRAVIGLMIYSLACVGAALAMKVEDVFPQNRRLSVQLHEMGGKAHFVQVEPERVEPLWTKRIRSRQSYIRIYGHRHHRLAVTLRREPHTEIGGDGITAQLTAVLAAGIAAQLWVKRA